MARSERDPRGRYETEDDTTVENSVLKVGSGGWTRRRPILIFIFISD